MQIKTILEAFLSEMNSLPSGNLLNCKERIVSILKSYQTELSGAGLNPNCTVMRLTAAIFLCQEIISCFINNNEEYASEEFDLASISIKRSLEMRSSPKSERRNVQAKYKPSYDKSAISSLKESCLSLITKMEEKLSNFNDKDYKNRISFLRSHLSGTSFSFSGSRSILVPTLSDMLVMLINKLVREEIPSLLYTFDESGHISQMRLCAHKPS